MDDDGVRHLFLPEHEQRATARREAAAFEAFAAGHRDDAAVPALQALRSGAHPRDVARDLRVAEASVLEWQSELTWLFLDFPPALARLRARSEHRRPREERTTATFNGVVNEIFVPELRPAGFKKKRFVWERSIPPIVHKIDIQRSWSTGDLLRFTSNVVVLVVGLVDRVRYDSIAALHGRIGGFLTGEDHWWSIQLGELARDCPDVLFDPDACLAELRAGVASALRWLDGIASLEQLVGVVRQGRPPLFGSALDAGALERLSRSD